MTNFSFKSISTLTNPSKTSTASRTGGSQRCQFMSLTVSTVVIVATTGGVGGGVVVGGSVGGGVVGGCWVGGGVVGC